MHDARRLRARRIGRTQFRPRMGRALGLIPPVNSQGNFNTEPRDRRAERRHLSRGLGMTGGVEVHAIFWAPPGTVPGFAPRRPAPGLRRDDREFFTDVAADSGPATEQLHAVDVMQHLLDADPVRPGRPGNTSSRHYSIAFNSAIRRRDPGPNPTATDHCARRRTSSACILDSSSSRRSTRSPAPTATPRGLHNLWYVFLPPDVDECISPNVCGTNAFGGYHSLLNVNGHGLTIYALTIDPLIETGGHHAGIDPRAIPMPSSRSTSPGMRRTRR